MAKLIIGVVAGIVVLIVGFLVIDPKFNNNGNQIQDPSDLLTSEVDKNSILITIEGEVNAPGTYTFQKDDTTMSDLIAQAGGLTSIADAKAFFPDTFVNKGKSYYIAPIYDTDDVCATSPIKKVNVNTGTNEMLSEIDGISQTIASSIVAYRGDHGEFKTLEDLLDVYGIGNATYKKIRNYVVLHE